MNILMFLVSFGLFLASCWVMGLAFVTPGFEVATFTAGVLLMSVAFAIPVRWLRNL